MRDDSFHLLKKLVEAPSPSGYEGPVIRIYREYVEQKADFFSIDVMGNASAIISGEQPGPRVMITGHCDEIGFMTQFIDEQGFIYFSAIGSIDHQLIPGRKVTIHTRQGPIAGVVGKKPVHLMEEDEKRKVPALSDLFIDIGARNKKETTEKIMIGDAITLDVNLERLLNNSICSKALDNKVGAFILAEVLRLVKERKKDLCGELICVATVQEEIGIRGARVSAYQHKPDVGIAVDVGFATDHPNVDKKRVGEFSLGKGPIITRGANINPLVFDGLLQIAQEKKIPYQIEGAPQTTGTEAGVMQLSRNGVAAGLVSVPCRYMHTPTEMVSLDDLETTIDLLGHFILEQSSDFSFIPI